MLIAIVFLGLTVVTVMIGMRALIEASSTSDDQAKVEAVLTSAADRLRAADYVPCPGVDGDYAHLSAAAASTVGWDAGQVVITDIQFWDPTLGGADLNGDYVEADGGWQPTNSFVADGGCQNDINLTTSRTLQKIIIEVSSPDDAIVRTIEVVKTPVVADPDAA